MQQSRSICATATMLLASRKRKCFILTSGTESSKVEGQYVDFVDDRPVVFNAGSNWSICKKYRGTQIDVALRIRTWRWMHLSSAVFLEVLHDTTLVVPVSSLAVCWTELLASFFRSRNHVYKRFAFLHRHCQAERSERPCYRRKSSVPLQVRTRTDVCTHYAQIYLDISSLYLD